jgi:hypothetical protein
MRGHVPLVGLLLAASTAGAQTLERAPVPSDAAVCLPCEAPVGVRRVARHATKGSVASVDERFAIPRRVRGAVFGATWGALAGAFIGGVVGNQLEECPGDGVCGAGVIGGAIVGGAIGAVLGAVLGATLTDPEPSPPEPAQ